MAKMKTRKAASKRMTVTGTGKIKRRRCGLTHLQTKRSSSSQSRNNDAAQDVSDANNKAARRMMPYS